MTLISIQEAADLHGVHADTLRAWEEKGYIKPHRTKGGHRRYDLVEIEKMLDTDNPEPKLGIVERQILVNLCYILETIRPKEADYWSRLSQALKFGYESEYCLDDIDKDFLSADHCEEVDEILNMYWVIQRIYDDAEDKLNVSECEVLFPGFESFYTGESSKRVGYARFICNESTGRFMGLKKRWEDFTTNSSLVMPKYRKMLVMWQKLLDEKRGREIHFAEVKPILESFHTTC